MRKFCFPLDHFHVVFDSRIVFPFASKLSTLIFDRFLMIQSTLNLVPPRSMIDVCMHMRGKRFPKRGQLKQLCGLVSLEVLVC